MGVALEPVNEKPDSLNVAFAMEPGVSARRWIGRLRLHAGKYILGITAPTGTGVQALPPGGRARQIWRLMANVPGLNAPLPELSDQLNRYTMTHILRTQRCAVLSGARDRVRSG